MGLSPAVPPSRARSVPCQRATPLPRTDGLSPCYVFIPAAWQD